MNIGMDVPYVVMGIGAYTYRRYRIVIKLFSQVPLLTNSNGSAYSIYTKHAFLITLLLFNQFIPGNEKYMFSLLHSSCFYFILYVFVLFSPGSETSSYLSTEANSERSSQRGARDVSDQRFVCRARDV